jgi:hypothetical protein
MIGLTKDILDCNGQDALQKVMEMSDTEEIWSQMIQAIAVFGTILKEPPIELIILWDLLLSELEEMMGRQEKNKEIIGLWIAKWVLFYQRVQNCSIKVPEPLAHFATLKSKVTGLLSLNVTMTDGGYSRFYSILSRRDGETVEKACALISYLFGNKRYTECRLLMEYMSRRKTTIGTYLSLDEFLWDACKCYFKQDGRILTREKIYQWMIQYKGGKYRTEASGILWMTAFGLANVPKEMTSIWTTEEEYILSQIQELLPSLTQVQTKGSHRTKQPNSFAETEDVDLWEFMNGFVPKSLPKYDLPNPEPQEVKTIRVKPKK